MRENEGQAPTPLAAVSDSPSEGAAAEGPAPVVPVSPSPRVRGQGPAVFGDAPLLLQLSTRFYGAQRSGDSANWLIGGQVCHPNDGEAAGLDLAGGWYDAGDHVKTTISMAYAAYVLLKGFEAFSSAYGDRYGLRYEPAANGVPDVLDEVRYATDYFVKAHPDANTLVGMVGTTNPDHSTWSPCVDQEALPTAQGGRPRRVSTVANADIAGITAGALALMSQLYQAHDAALSAEYLRHAREIFALGEGRPMGSNPGLYGQTGDAWIDEMLVGATELYRATGEQSYLTAALDYNTRLAAHQWAPNYSQAADFARHSLYVAGQSEAVAEFWQLDVENYIAHVSTEPPVMGISFFDDWGSLRYASGAALSAALLYEVSGDTRARDFAIGQLNYIMGDNSYDRSFVVGFGNNPPVQPHHRNAQGTGDMAVLPFRNTLSGALVGGPSLNAVNVTTVGYTDSVQDYVDNEVALDYNSGVPGLSAFGVLESVPSGTAQ